MTDANFEYVSRRNAISVEFHGETFVLAAKKLKCPDCPTGWQTDAVFTEIVEEGGHTALALGVKCQECKSDTVHVCY